VKKFFAILFALLMSGAMVSLTISTHYCGGVMVKSNASFSGTLATCGMENDNDSCPNNSQHIKSHCCETIVIKYSTDNNYTAPEMFSEGQKAPGHIIQVVNLADHQYREVTTSVVFLSQSPPNTHFPFGMTLAQICVFRI